MTVIIERPDGTRSAVHGGPWPITLLAEKLAGVPKFPDSAKLYTCAEFGILRSELAAPEARLHALLWDAPTAGFGRVYIALRELLDRVAPGQVEAVETRIRRDVFGGFNLDPDTFRTEVRSADTLALAVAVRDVLGAEVAGVDAAFGLLVKDIGAVSMRGACLTPSQAAEAFVARFHELRREHGPEVSQ